MSAELIGQVSIGQVVPTTAALVAQLTAELTGKLTGYLNISAALTLTAPALSAQLEGTLALVAQLQAQISAGISISPPGVGLSIAAVAGIMAELNASLAALLALTVTLGTAGVYVIHHDGPARTHGSEVQAVVNRIAPAGNNVHSVTLLATAPAVFEALGKVVLTG